MEQISIKLTHTFVGIGGAGKKIVLYLNETEKLQGNYVEVDEYITNLFETSWFSTADSLILCAGLGKNIGTSEIVKIAKQATNAGKKLILCVTLPFSFEGRSKMVKAEEALTTLKKLTNHIVILNNEELYSDLNKNEPMYDIFKKGYGTIAKEIQKLL
ncbi:FtsZ/tubulin family protein [Litchfieldia alkalitelluris]|uniref:hypothetical protein n=1 Tax=Litchfieldia alkalitelluris TaxID=304268 RepID=UPI001474EFFB|nr:hypothetical protein [Litchfieldia alkalitelluris]